MSNSGSLQRPLPPLSEDFPLKQHKTGKFRKAIKGKDYYFGRREDPAGVGEEIGPHPDQHRRRLRAIDAKPISASTTVALTVTLDEPVTLGTLILGSGSSRRPK